MSAIVATAPQPRPRPAQSILRHHLVRAVISIAVFLVLWELGARFKLPWVGEVPPPTVVLNTWLPLLQDEGYWYSWLQSSRRVLSGFLAAMLIGIPFGLAMATSRVFHDVSFPVFEILRPIPPLAWVPAAIIFWPTQELSIGFVIFLGHRVAIMTTRPCKPKKILEVDIPHPRNYGVLTSPRFRELMEETVSAVHEEAVKAFEAGEKEM